MKVVTMLEFRRDAEGVLRRVANGERLVLSHRGKPAARLEPVETGENLAADDDPFFLIGARARRSPKGRTTHREIDKHLYGG